MFELPGQTPQRPHVLAYYDLPPPSPPPNGPLPDVPSDISRSTSPSWSMMDSSHSRFPRSAPADTNDPRGLQQRPMASPLDRDPRPTTAAPHPLSREITVDVPTIVEPTPPVQRGRVSPFPTAPVLPREQTTGLMRQTSKMTREAVGRALRNGNGPASASPYPPSSDRWPAQERIVIQRGPASAQPLGASGWPTRDQQLGVRSSSAMGMRRVGAGVGGPRTGHESWIDYGDDDEDDSPSPPTTIVPSAEPSPDVRAILAGFRAQQEAAKGGLRAPDVASGRDTVSGIVAGYERETVYLGVDEEGGDRSSVWSEANTDAGSRSSFLDGERSAAIRAKFIERVEAMYGKDVIPPVPSLGEGVTPAR